MTAATETKEMKMLTTVEMLLAADNIEAVHGVQDATKFEALIASMRINGWQGRPLLVVAEGRGFVALTGSHRLAAAVELDLDVPCLVINTDDYEGDEWEWSCIMDAHDDVDRLVALAAAGMVDAELGPAVALMRQEIDSNV